MTKVHFWPIKFGVIFILALYVSKFLMKIKHLKFKGPNRKLNQPKIKFWNIRVNMKIESNIKGIKIKKFKT